MMCTDRIRIHHFWDGEIQPNFKGALLSNKKMFCVIYLAFCHSAENWDSLSRGGRLWYSVPLSLLVASERFI